MKLKRIVAILISATILLATFVVLKKSPPADPEFDGRPLSSWIADLKSVSETGLVIKKIDLSSNSTGVQAQRAIQALGTNAIPWLLFELTRTSNIMDDLKEAAAALFCECFKSIVDAAICKGFVICCRDCTASVHTSRYCSCLRPTLTLLPSQKRPL